MYLFMKQNSKPLFLVEVSWQRGIKELKVETEIRIKFFCIVNRLHKYDGVSRGFLETVALTLITVVFQREEGRKNQHSSGLRCVSK